ncbi:uncharacterized protein LOC117412896 [Acipenser ruthenus]|uniref:uncharacterized protein LOC117412896 n=1 Tax=Acipenser ruthenus TaxID=7906 RepID=UPI0027423E5B|nr:uncharacterized protein LOC117412896 [Acipenser ruthenus]
MKRLSDSGITFNITIQERAAEDHSRQSSRQSCACSCSCAKAEENDERDEEYCFHRGASNASSKPDFSVTNSVLKSEQQRRSITLSLPTEFIHNNIAFLQVKNKICIAGWRMWEDHYLEDTLHVGDEVCQLNNMIPQNIDHLKLFSRHYAKEMSSLEIRRLPEASVFTCVRTDCREDWGIHLDGPKIRYITPGSSASQCGLDCPMAVTTESTVPWCITEINFKPVSLIQEDKRSTQRLLKRIDDGTKLYLVLQPLDFVCEMSRKLKMMADWEQYDADVCVTDGLVYISYL